MESVDILEPNPVTGGPGTGSYLPVSQNRIWGSEELASGVDPKTV